MNDKSTNSTFGIKCINTYTSSTVATGIATASITPTRILLGLHFML